MPGGGGYELIRRLREGGCNVPAIAITARVGVEDTASSLAAGFQMHLPKPIEPYDLVVEHRQFDREIEIGPATKNKSVSRHFIDLLFAQSLSLQNFWLNLLKLLRQDCRLINPSRFNLLTCQSDCIL